MTREFFNQQFAALVNAYTIAQKLSGEAQDVYWRMLQEIPEADFAEGVRECLASCKFFPTISELGEASLPAVTDYKAPLPPIDHERPTLNWRQQIKRGMHKPVKAIDVKPVPKLEAPMSSVEHKGIDELVKSLSSTFNVRK